MKQVQQINQINDTVYNPFNDFKLNPLINNIFQIPKSYEKDDRLLKYEKHSISIPSDNSLVKIKETKCVTPLNLEYVSEITKSDVLFGERGDSDKFHENHKKYQELLNLHRPAYVRAVKLKKSAIARIVVEEFKASEPNGRFLAKEEETGRFYVIGDRVSAKEICKALGENMCKEEISDERVNKENIVDEQATSRNLSDLNSKNADEKNKKRKLNFDGNEIESISHMLKSPRINDAMMKGNNVRTEANNNVLNKIADYFAANNVSMPNLPPCNLNNIHSKPDLRFGCGITRKSLHHDHLPRLPPNDIFSPVIKAAETPKNLFASTMNDPYIRAEAMRRSFYSAFSVKSKMNRNIMNLKTLSSNETLLNIDKMMKDNQSIIDASRLKPLTSAVEVKYSDRSEFKNYIKRAIDDDKCKAITHGSFCASDAHSASMTDYKVSDKMQQSTSVSIISMKSNKSACLGKDNSSASLSSTEDEKDSSNRADNSTELQFVEVREHDILCGRGGMTNNHFGNKRFRVIVSRHRQDYMDAPKIKKPDVARLIVKTIRADAGRFLKKDVKTGKWYEINDKKAAEKASQALREKLHLRH